MFPALEAVATRKTPIALMRFKMTVLLRLPVNRLLVDLRIETSVLAFVDSIKTNDLMRWIIARLLALAVTRLAIDLSDAARLLTLAAKTTITALIALTITLLDADAVTRLLTLFKTYELFDRLTVNAFR